FSCFSPLMRAHGTQAREPWEYGSQAVKNYRKFAWVRENLLDYLYDAAVESHQTGIPMLRPLAMEFPSERRLITVNDQYMLGSDLLVAPVVTEWNRRKISLPGGTWTSLWDGTELNGPISITKDVALTDIAVYLRAGAVLPVRLNKELTFGESMTNDMVQALMITLPGKDTTLRRLTFQKAPVVMRLEGGELTITLDEVRETRYLILQGTQAASVMVGTSE